jgi:lipopolysaccharide export system permease protein
VPKNIDIYAFGSDGTLQSFIHADSADIQLDGTWRLTGVVRKHIEGAQFQTEHLASLSWRSFISPQQTQLLTLPPESMPPIALYRYVRDLGRRHLRAIRYEQELWTKVSIPLSMVALVMIAAPFVFGPPRSQNAGRQIAVGAGFGMVFTLSQQIVGRLDLLLGLSPPVAALAPSVLLMALAAYLFRRGRRTSGGGLAPMIPDSLKTAPVAPSAQRQEQSEAR